MSDQAERAPDARPGRPVSLPLTIGDPAPWFKAPTVGTPEFVFDSAAGRWVLLGFLPLAPGPRREALVAAAAARGQFDDARASLFLVVRDPETAATARDMRGLRWILDLEGEISRLYGALSADGVETPLWILLDSTLRVAGRQPLGAARQVFAALANLPVPEDHAGVRVNAPVLTAARIFDDDLCRRLIALHQAEGGVLTGVMRDEGDRTIEVQDDHKRRRDISIADRALRAEIREALQRRLFPMIKQAFQFDVAQIERHLVSCYDAAEGGVFGPHRDNTTWETAGRGFACTINLNDDFEGGALRFPEYGLSQHRPPRGGAVVFSCGLMHEALPVTAGRRYAFLPFLYDDAGWRRRQDYLHRLEAR